MKEEAIVRYLEDVEILATHQFSNIMVVCHNFGDRIGITTCGIRKKKEGATYNPCLS
jgi:hypothetical protein